MFLRTVIARFVAVLKNVVRKMLSYSELITIPDFEERIKYLKTDSKVGDPTFDFDRYINQHFYLSQEWKTLRPKIIVRDLGHDLAMPGDEYEIFNTIFIHHINPLTKEQIIHGDVDAMFNPQNLVTVSRDTHNMIHYGRFTHNKYVLTERQPNDTIPWRK